MEACATIARCTEEKEILLRESGDAVQYFSERVEWHKSALSRLAASAPQATSKGQASLLKSGLRRAERLAVRMQATHSQLQALFGVILVPGVTPAQADNDSAVIGVDPEIPDGDSSESEEEDVGYNSEGDAEFAADMDALSVR